MMKILSVISNLLNPVRDIIDDLHTSTAEKGEIQIKLKGLANDLSQMQIELTNKVMEYEMNLINKQAEVITAEANAKSWLTKSWRPITMLTFLGLLIANQFGLTNEVPQVLQERLMDIIQLGLGGYVIGRSGEKIAKVAAEAYKNKGEE